ncbi:MAG: DUF2279 domain-containing protein [Bacteroidota bacterium]
MVLSFYITHGLAQSDSINYKQRKAIVWASGSTAYAAGMTGLYQLWYKDYPQSSFHFFNDNAEWQKQDKLGHVGTAYYLSKWTGELYRYAGYSNNKAAFFGALTGFGFQFTIEMFDGFSSQWGFSSGDFLANTFGAGLYYAQQVGWKDQLVKFKMSYHPTDFPMYNPGLLGENDLQRLFKDYNGQTYWISFNIKGLLFQNKKIPAWLNLALGYTASGMTGARVNKSTYNGKEVPQFVREHAFVLSPDIDLTKINSKRKSINFIKEVFGFIKVPLPAIKLKNNGKVSGELIYF